MILQVLLWSAVVEFIGILFFPLCAFLFSSFKDKGFCISKVMGILIIGYVVWILGILKISSATQYSIIILVSILFFLWSVWFYYSKTTLLRLIRGNFSTFVISEIVFISAFFLFLFFRVYDPAILNTEQPMDFMFLNSIINGVKKLKFMNGGCFEFEGKKIYITRSGYTGEDLNGSNCLILSITPSSVTNAISRGIVVCLI